MFTTLPRQILHIHPASPLPPPWILSTRQLLAHCGCLINFLKCWIIKRNIDNEKKITGSFWAQSLCWESSWAAVSPPIHLGTLCSRSLLRAYSYDSTAVVQPPQHVFVSPHGWLSRRSYFRNICLNRIWLYPWNSQSKIPESHTPGQTFFFFFSWSDFEQTTEGQGFPEGHHLPYLTLSCACEVLE